MGAKCSSVTNLQFANNEVSKAFFGTKCLNIFGTGCLIYARQKKDILLVYVKVKITPVETFRGSLSKEIAVV